MNNPTEKILLLDIGGVIMTDPMGAFITRLSQESKCPREGLESFYRDTLYAPFWNGTVSEDEFWSKLLDRCGLPDQREAWRSWLLAAMTPLPAAGKLSQWRETCELWVLSNHRSEWLRPLLNQYRLTEFFSRLFISDEVGLAKPDPALYALIKREAGSKRMLYVDDRAPFVQVGREVGIPAILADEHTAWIDVVDSWIESGEIPNQEDDL